MLNKINPLFGDVIYECHFTSFEQVVAVDIVGPDLCRQMLTGGLPYDADAMVCAGGRDKDACQVAFKYFTILYI